MLFLALARWPYEYYVILRILVFFCAGFLAIKEFQLKSMGWCFALVGLALLFNPFVPVHLTRTTWAILDMAAAGFLTLHFHVRRFQV